MLTCKKQQAAFTLIELLVVVIIVAVLAAVGVPLLSANVERARMTEAEAGLGTIRTALRALGVEDPTTFPASPTDPALGLSLDDFQGQFFDLAAYSFGAGGDFGPPQAYCIQALGDDSTAVGHLKVAELVRSMDQDGTISKIACP